MLELIYKNDFGNAMYDRSTKTLRTQHVGLVKIEAITDLLRRVMEFSGREEITTMLANLTEMQGTFTGALDFFEQEFYPRMIKNELRAYACALSKNVFTKFAASQLQKKVGGKLEWHAFSNLPAAESWIDTQIGVINIPHAKAS